MTVDPTDTSMLVLDDDPLLKYYKWSYRDEQAIALCLVSTFTGCLSLFGSGSIVVSIARDRRARSRVYERFIMAISAADIIATLSMAVGVYMVPAHTGMAWAWGNTATCSLAAFFFNYFTAVCWTNMNLALYFYCSVCRSWTDDYMVKHYEKYMHTAAFATATLFAIAVAVTRSGNPNAIGHFCAMEYYPTACLDKDVDIECERGYGWVFYWWCVLMFLEFVPTFIAIGATVQVTRAVLRSTRHAMRVGSDATVRRQKRVMRQAILYLLSYLNTFIWPVILGLVSFDVMNWEVHKTGPFVFAFLAHALIPLQGFFNYFIFRRRKIDLCKCFLPSTLRDSSRTSDASGNATMASWTGRLSRIFRSSKSPQGSQQQQQQPEQAPASFPLPTSLNNPLASGLDSGNT